jgi:hypothetical protein
MRAHTTGEARHPKTHSSHTKKGECGQNERQILREPRPTAHLVRHNGCLVHVKDVDVHHTSHSVVGKVPYLKRRNNA